MKRETIQQRILQFERAHRDRGLPVTAQARAVFETILEQTDHPPADAVYAAVRKRMPGISRMTVYRVLEKLARLELIAKTCHPGAAARYDPVLNRHHHLVCVDCGIIVDLEEARLNGLPWPDVRRFEFEIKDYMIHFRGRCAACRKRGDKPAAIRRPASARGKMPGARRTVGRT